MALLAPFQALRPSPESAARVAAVPYDVVSTSEARALAAGNPLSFLHVSRAEIDLPPGENPYTEAVYQRAADNFRALRDGAPLLVESVPALYVYRLRAGTHEQTGIAGCFSVDEYERGTIKRHEHTRPDKEDDRTTHLIRLRAQTGPVFLTYPARPDIDGAVARTTSGVPLYDFAAPDGVQHTVWRVAEGDARALVEGFAALRALYIADGHHRAASAARARRHFGAGGAAGEWDTVLAVAFPDTQVRILPYNRVVTDLAGLSSESFLATLRERLTVSNGGPVPARAGEVSMFLAGDWHTLALGGIPQSMTLDERLDVSRLQALVLSPLLAVGDPRTDKRIDFVGGSRGTAELERRVLTGEAAVAFSMFPVDVHDLMAIADAGGVMPPKSTWFEPKLRDGLLSHLI